MADPPIVTPTKPTAPAPVDPLFTSVYTLYYRKETNHLQFKHFRFHGGIQEAKERGRKHCERIGAKFHFVQPLISNLDLEEQHYLGDT